MAEHVVKVLADANGTRSADLVSAQIECHEHLNAVAARRSEVRITDPAEALAVVDVLAGLRDAIGAFDVVTYHECRHDEGVGTCTPEAR